MTTSHLQWLERPHYKAESADDLRELITQAELIIGNLRRSGPRAQTVLFLMDAISGLMARLQETGIDLRPEATRIETIERLILSKSHTLVREVGGMGALAEARKAFQPPEEQWWWYLDRKVAEDQRRTMRRLLIGAGIAAGILLVLGVINHFLTDPKAAAVLGKKNNAEQALQKGDVAGALASYREAVEISPADPELRIWIGVLEERLGNKEAAAEAYQTAQDMLADQARFLMMRGTVLGQIGELDRALADAQMAIELKPDFAEAYFVLGGIYESKGEKAKAIAAFDKTAELAGQQNNSALVVTAKYRMGMLMQSGF